MNDPLNVRVAVVGLVAVVLTAVVGAIYLAGIDRALPESVVAIGSAAAGVVGTYMGVRPRE